MDEKPGRLLVRSNMPLLSDGSFAYKEIRAAVGRDLSGYDEFVSVSLIDCVGERDRLSRELRAFGVDPDAEVPESVWPPYLHGFDVSRGRGDGNLRYDGGARRGRIVWWPIEGLPDGQEPGTYLGSPGWNFAGLVRHVAELFGEDGPSRAVLFHCTLGADRTGALHRGYLMGVKGMSKPQAYGRADALCGRPNADYERLSNAYWNTL